MLDVPLEPRVEARRGTPRAGAAGSMTRSIEELAESARRIADGDVVVSLDTDLVDNYFVLDRIDHDDDDYTRLRDAIAGEEQSTPILVRPHPKGLLSEVREKAQWTAPAHLHRRSDVIRIIGRARPAVKC